MAEAQHTKELTRMVREASLMCTGRSRQRRSAAVAITAISDAFTNELKKRGRSPRIVFRWLSKEETVTTWRGDNEVETHLGICLLCNRNINITNLPRTCMHWRSLISCFLILALVPASLVGTTCSLRCAT